MPNADPAAQRVLLDIADIDRAADTATHRRDTLPEHAVIAESTGRLEELQTAVVLAQTDVDDLDRAMQALEGEIDTVRSRTDRDNERLTSGALPAKEAQGLQQELESLARRQSTLEDDALELMEKRETAGAALSDAEAELERVRADVQAATIRRDDALADFDDELGRLAQRRTELTAAVPGDLLAVYDRVRRQGRAAAGALTGDRCGACQMSLDRQSLEEIHGAPADTVCRCPECSAVLVRTG